MLSTWTWLLSAPWTLCSENQQPAAALNQSIWIWTARRDSGTARMDYFYQKEDTDGIRFSVNVWPANKTEQSRMALPLGCMYSPMKRGTYVQKVAYEPLQCKGNCRTYLNPYWFVLSLHPLLYPHKPKIFRFPKWFCISQCGQISYWDWFWCKNEKTFLFGSFALSCFPFIRLQTWIKHEKGIHDLPCSFESFAVRAIECNSDPRIHFFFFFFSFLPCVSVLWRQRKHLSSWRCVPDWVIFFHSSTSWIPFWSNFFDFFSRIAARWISTVKFGAVLSVCSAISSLQVTVESLNKRYLPNWCLKWPRSSTRSPNRTIDWRLRFSLSSTPVCERKNCKPWKTPSSDRSS